MAKNTVQEWDGDVASNNSDIGGINISENCPPSNINDALREIMKQIKEWQSGASGVDFVTNGEATFNSNVNLNSTLTVGNGEGLNGQFLKSLGAGQPPVWEDTFVKGMIMMWSGIADDIPTGWQLCNGTNGTPDLRDRFVIGAGGNYEVNATGGSKDAVLVSHNHTVSGSTNTTGDHVHSIRLSGYNGKEPRAASQITSGNDGYQQAGTGGNYLSTAGNHAHSFSGTTTTKGSSATNANLPPYMALCYIMKL